jgi:glycerophosphoryl diester phosphodiesterase
MNNIKRMMLFTILLFTYGCSQQTIEPTETIEPTTLPGKDFLIIAHRGASAYTTGHTLAAYELAVEMGADYIEIDLQMTKDGKLVALHDSVITLFNAKQAVADVTFDDIQLHYPGKDFDINDLNYTLPSFDNMQIVNLEEILVHFGDTVNYYIEIKSPKMYPGIEEELLNQLGKYNLLNRDDVIPKVIIQSFDTHSLKEIFAMEPTIPLIKLYTFDKEANLSEKELSKLTQYASGIGLNANSVSRKFIESMHSEDLFVHPFTVNDEGTMRILINLGANGIFTDRPDLAYHVRNEKNRLDKD